MKLLKKEKTTREEYTFVAVCHALLSIVLIAGTIIQNELIMKIIGGVIITVNGFLCGYYTRSAAILKKEK